MRNVLSAIDYYVIAKGLFGNRNLEALSLFMRKKTEDKKEVYGGLWNIATPELYIEMRMIRGGGYIKKKDGTIIGNGLAFHFKQMQKLLWPSKIWHKWNELLLENFCSHKIIGVLGPASSGKTREASDFMLCDYYCWADCTTVLVSSTEREMLEMRAWGEIKRAHNAAKERYDWLPGQLIESRQRIVTDERSGDKEGRDFRNGLQGCACKKGGSYVGLGSYAGVHNKRTSLLADEGGFMPIAYLDAISNLSKAKHFKGIVIGNPKDTTDALGKVCEPSAELGGWDGGIDQTGGTKTWPTRFPGGICVQLVGTDSPNFDGKLGIALINKEQIDSDIAFYGKDSLQYTMMDEARMPRGQASRRIVTRRLCEKGNALEEPVWADEKRVKLGMMDAAYRGVGGDRCTFGGLEFGTGINKEGKHIPMLHLMFSTVVPITGGVKDEPEEQIVNFVKPICEENGIPAENLFLDSTGRGSLISAFARLWSPHVKGIEFGSQASADRIVSNEIRELCKDYFFNRVSELWWVIRMIIEAGQFRGLSKEIMDELCMREWTIVGGHKIQVEPKDKTKVRMGRSPDLADMLAVGCEGARQLGFMVTKLASVTYQENEDAWKDELRKRASNLRRVGQLVRV